VCHNGHEGPFSDADFFLRDHSRLSESVAAPMGCLLTWTNHRWGEKAWGGREKHGADALVQMATRAYLHTSWAVCKTV